LCNLLEFPNAPPAESLNKNERNHNAAYDGKQDGESNQKHKQFADNIFHVLKPAQDLRWSSNTTQVRNSSIKDLRQIQAQTVADHDSSKDFTT
jgi:hypothetical protein